MDLLSLSEFLPGKLKILLRTRKMVFHDKKKEAQHFPHSVLHFLWRGELEIDGGRKEPGLRQSRFFANDAAYFSTLMQYVSEYTPTSIREVVAASKMSLFSLFFF